MKDDIDSHISVFVAGIAFGIVIITALLFLLGENPAAVRRAMEKEAVEKGHAAYVIETKDGNPEIVFYWK